MTSIGAWFYYTGAISKTFSQVDQTSLWTIDNKKNETFLSKHSNYHETTHLVYEVLIQLF
jgi:hypothetical protein